MAPGTEATVLEARGIVKRYPGTLALRDVTYRVIRNQVNVLIGENGAGKSTLMRILAGIEEADEGQIFLDDSPVQMRSPRDAARHGIAIVHQELAIFPNLGLAENIFAGREAMHRGLLLNRREQEERSALALQSLGMRMDVRTLAGAVSLGQRQLVEIARALDQGARILILDEPTSALSNAEADILFSVIGDLKRRGVTIIYISHRLHELIHLGDHFTILRSGAIVGEADRSSASREWIVERMSGRAAQPPSSRSEIEKASSPLLRTSGLSLRGDDVYREERTVLNDISIEVRAGEIVGLYGLLGSGRTELLECLAGKRIPSSGTMQVQDKPVRFRSVPEAARAGILLVPEDRQRDGLFPDLSIRENIMMAARKNPLLDRRNETSLAVQMQKELNIAAGDLELPVLALSGGNQQKVLIARCLLRNPLVLLLDEPTRGVDVTAKAEIYSILRGLAAKGVGILFSSSEIEETQKLADRALVLSQGRIAAQLKRDEITDEALFPAASPTVQAIASDQPGAHRA